MVGDAQLSGENITIGGLQETTTTTHEEETIVTSTTIGVKNAYVDAAYAADAVTKAAEDVERAERDLKDAEQRVKDGTLAESALDDYKANLAAATTQLGQATLNLAASGATAAGTTGTGGFYASATAETTQTTNSSTSTQSNFVGSNVNVTGNAAFSANKALNIIGAQANIGENLALDAEDITITAGENTYSEESSSSTQTASASMSTAPGSNVSGTLSTNDTQSSASGTTYTNSLLNAGSITSNSDTLTVAGASVIAQGDLDINANTVEVRSLQDTHQSSSNSSGGSVSGSQAGVSSVGFNESSSNSESAIVTQQTMLIGGASGAGDVNINADTMHIAGAVVASATQKEDGSFTDNHSQGTGSLNIVADTVTYEDIQDYSTSESSGTNANIGLTNNTQEVTKDMQTAGLDATVTVDHRLASEEGREAIRQDFEDSENHFNDEILGGLTEGVKAGSISAGFDAIGRKIDIRNGLTAIQADNQSDTEEKLNAIDGDAEGKQEGMQELSDALTGEAGVVDQEVLLYMNELDGAAGIHHDEGNLSAVNAAVTDMTNGEDIVGTTVHETTHHILNEQDKGYDESTKEYASSKDGDYAKEIWAQENRRNGNVTGGSAQDVANWNTNNQNSAIITQNTERVSNVPASEREELWPLVIIGGIKLAEMAFTAYEAKQLKDAYDAGEVTKEELAEMAAITAGTTAASAVPIPGSGIVSKIVAKGAERFKTIEESADVDIRKVTEEFGERKIGSGSNSEQLEVGKVEAYKDSKKITGDGSVHRDHQPSKAALIRRAEEIKGEPLTPAEIKRIENNSKTVTVPADVHKAGPTYGGQNTRALQEADAKDLQGAATRDADAMVSNAKDLSPESVPALKNACDKIQCITNDQYDDFLREQLGE